MTAIIVWTGSLLTSSTLPDEAGRRIEPTRTAKETAARLRAHGAALVVVDVCGDADRAREARRLCRDVPGATPVTVSDDGDAAPRADVILSRDRDISVQLSSALEAIRADTAASRSSGASASKAMIGRSAPLRRAADVLRRVAPTDATVLLLGETGTGKELAARATHEQSARGSGPFVAVNCAALPENLVESELFGHEAGAFTGATRRKIGRIEQAHGGTLFLDEIAPHRGATFRSQTCARSSRIVSGRSSAACWHDMMETEPRLPRRSASAGRPFSRNSRGFASAAAPGMPCTDDHPVQTYRVPGRDERSEDERDEEVSDDRDRAARKVLRCDRCELEITDEAHRIAKGGRHEHDCVNPGGYDYHIGCFAAAPGCHPVGIPTGYWSWFPGYMWQNDNCARCGRHLGWRFHCADDVFHGLILARLI